MAVTENKRSLPSAQPTTPTAKHRSSKRATTAKPQKTREAPGFPPLHRHQTRQDHHPPLSRTQLPPL